MKKRIFTISLTVCLLFASLFVPSYGYGVERALYYQLGHGMFTGTYLSNPGGTSVFAYKFSHYVSDDDWSTYESTANSYWDSNYSTATRLATASGKYNCHAYAWVSENIVDAIYWVNDPSNYYKTGSNYYEVTTPAVGDIICYFYNNGTPNNYSDDVNLHSGIVVMTGVATSNNLCGNSNTVVVESKWSDGGLYRHNGYECPYTDYCLNVDSTRVESSRADYVKYYRKSGHTHSFTNYTDSGRLDYHESACSCGRVIREMHNWVSAAIRPSSSVSPMYIPQYVCSDCGAVTLNPVIPSY